MSFDMLHLIDKQDKIEHRVDAHSYDKSHWFLVDDKGAR